MAHYPDKETLKVEINRIAAEKFGPSDTPFEMDEILTNMLVYHDVHQVITTPDIQADIQKIIASAEDESKLAERLSALNHQVEGLRAVLYIAKSDNPKKMVAAFAHEAFLDEKDIALLQELVRLYASVLQQLKATDELDFVEANEESMLRCLTEELVTAYFENFYASRRWLRTVEAIFPVDMIEHAIDSGDPNAMLPQTWFKLLFNDAHYVKAIERFESLQQPFLADVARIFLFYGRIMRGYLEGQDYIQSDATEIGQVLDRLDHYESVELTVFEDFQDFVNAVHGSLRLVVGMHFSLPTSERIEHLEKAERAFDSCRMLVLRSLGPMLCWQRAQLHQGFEREKLELTAFNRVNVLLAESALEKEPLQRISSMMVLMGLPGGWKFAKGNFQGAIESATMAKSLAIAWVKTIQDEMRPALEEMQKDIAASDTSQEKRTQILKLRNMLLSLLENSHSVVFASDLLILTSHAKLAEARGDFMEAYQLYQDAARLEKECLNRLRSLFLTLFDTATTSAKLMEQGFQHDARSAYFQGMALFNRGDQHLMERDYSAANQNYLEAKQAFETAVGLWAREAERLPPSQVDERMKASQEQNINEVRIRYSDVKVEIATAEQFSALGQAWQAAKHFEKAAGILVELLAGTILKEESRNLEVLKASEDFCRGRSLLETDLDARRQDNVQEGIQLLDSAALRFEQCGEQRWAHYINGLRYEYEAMINWNQAQTSTPPNATYAQLAKSKAQDAAATFRQLGVEKRARYLESWIRTMPASFEFTTVMLPKLLDPLTGSQTPIQKLVDRSHPIIVEEMEGKMEDKLTKLQARAIALGHRLDEAKVRLSRGRLSDGQYTDLAADLESERIEILLELQNVLQGKDENIDAIVRDAINGERETILMDRLAKVAEKKGLGQKIVEELNKHKGSIVSWLVEIGINIAKHV